MSDEQGNRSNQDAVVTLVATAGEFVGVDAKPNQPGFQVQARQGQGNGSEVLMRLQNCAAIK